MFIKVTKDKEKIRVNVNNISIYSDYKGGTAIKLFEDIWIEAEETPEQIDAKIEKLGISIGGEY